MVNQVVISGMGHVSRAGRGIDEVRETLTNTMRSKQPEQHLGERLVDSTDFLTYRAPKVELSEFGIPRREHRFLGPMMRLAIAASHDALIDANIQDQSTFLTDLELIIACGAGVRDQDIDLEIARDLSAGGEVELGELLTGRLRPTEFLCQLPNLTAGNICSFFGIKGANRTLMGGETAGLHALRMAFRKIASGQADRILVGGAGFGQCFYTNLALAQAGVLARSSSETNRTALGSASSFFLLESRAAADAREADWREVVEAITIADEPSGPHGTGDAGTTAHARISNHPDAAPHSGDGLDTLDVAALMGNTREDAIFGGMTLGIAMMRNRGLNLGVVSMQHSAGPQSYVELSGGASR